MTNFEIIHVLSVLIFFWLGWLIPYMKTICFRLSVKRIHSGKFDD